MSSTPPIHIIEPRLVGNVGHCLSLVHALATAIDEAGAGKRLTVWGGAGAAAVWAGPGQLRPYFHRRWRRLQALWLLRRLLREPGRILVATAGTADLVMADWAAAGRTIAPHKLHLFVHWVGAKADKARLLTRIARRQPNLRIFGPTRAVVDLFARCGFEASLAPYPVAPVDSPAERDAPAAAEPFRHLLVAGGARMDKGLDRVVALVEEMQARGMKLPITVQTSAEAQHARDDEVAGLLERLRRSGYGGLELHAEPMSADAYRALFGGAVVLQPYRASDFADRVSGVTLDALGAGAPVVTTAGTWMARLIGAHEAGIAVADLGPASLLQAIETVLADHAGFAARARLASARVREAHSARTLIDALLAEEAAS
jgi:glycosyltransferase involved in cell wall biosynthesis